MVPSVMTGTRRFLIAILLPPLAGAFVTHLNWSPGRVLPTSFEASSSYLKPKIPGPTTVLQSQRLTVEVDASLDDEKVRALFAWIARAYAGEYEYNNLMLAIAAIFGNLPPDSEPVLLAEKALKLLPEDAEETPCGEPFSLYERESNSLGAMGAAQWSGRWKTRPHALLQIQNLTHVDEWIKGLPRGCRRTLKRAVALEEGGNFTVRTLPIYGNQPAPHSCLAHFRCVVAHEVRLLANARDGADVSDFFSALGEAVGRYMGTTRMAGEIREYSNSTTGKVIAVAHEVRKGRTTRGQWFYCTDEAAKNYIWFHSVYDLVRRSIEADGVDVVDLGPSGSDAFSELKERYGFLSVDDWPAVADYEGPFWYNQTGTPKKGLTGLASFLERQLGID
ncbi:expressed unknown protein [Seminavis robusta]|uniref:Uncharacterized protein n=1 Tax=Seminavis robusta TaxID=568900 RepID=A0A9N8F4F6_9STRA|nr:expressed unknown protein [Seminavis robusta]|eukprot:Sro3445_g348120.1 n/a (391) ;mRNA; f:4628-6017